MASTKTQLTECPECKGEVTYKGSGSTMVGYFSPDGHDHNDNCVTYEWWCKNGHVICERQQNYCPVEGCDWKGKTDCFCSKLGISAVKMKITRTRNGKIIEEN